MHFLIEVFHWRRLVNIEISDYYINDKVLHGAECLKGAKSSLDDQFVGQSQFDCGLSVDLLGYQKLKFGFASALEISSFLAVFDHIAPVLTQSCVIA
jgi:hypothetical protein